MFLKRQFQNKEWDKLPSIQILIFYQFVNN